jgi:putative tricarboxylic transport membrane protein
MFDVFFSALGQLLVPVHLLYLMLGVLIGLVVGFLPGLGGIAGLSIILPFVYGMDPTSALALMIGLLSPLNTSDTIPAVLMGVPGTSAAQATVVDGFPMAKKGEGGRALGAAFIASMFGGVFGAVVLTGAIFAARPIILAMGFGEQLMLVILALSMIGMLTGSSALKGLGTCCVGLLLGSMGSAPATGEFRLAFETIYLSDGVPIVIVGLGMFAMPEIIELLRRSTRISESATLGAGMFEGVKDAFRHWWIVLRCSIIGCIVGFMPGLGGSVVDWIAYGHVVQTSKNRENFGKGDVRGVLAPESANNAKEGGALIPTLLFGIPGSGSMAILLGGFILIGIEPGIPMLTKYLDLTFVMIWSVALANIAATGICLFTANYWALLTTVRYALLAPFMIVLIYFAAFQATRDWYDLIALFVMGTLGVQMKRFGWSRPAMLIGYFLAPQLEPTLYQAQQVYGLTFFERPIVIVLVLLTLASVWAAWRYNPNHGKTYEETGPHGGGGNKLPQLVFGLFMAGFSAYALADSFQYSRNARIFPMSVAIIALAFLAPLMVQMYRARAASGVLYDSEREPADRSDYYYLGWMLVLLGLIGLGGFAIGSALFIFLFTTREAGVAHLRNGALAIGCVGWLSLMAYVLTLQLPPGLLQTVVDMPMWLGGSL